jgi:protein O-mannosyl-transferase
MAKAQRKPQTPPPAKTAARTAAANAFPQIQLPDWLGNIRLQSLILFGFALLLYANTLTHGFVLDDDIVIKENMFTKQGVSGIPGILSKDTFFGYFKVEGKETLVSGGRYRPLTLVLFALVFQLFGANTFVFHLLTVALFGATVVVLYRTLLALLSPRGGAYAALMAFLTSALFAAHPIHTEVVANIKGCDEIVTLLCSLAALWATFRAFDTGKSSFSLLAAVLFFLACLSKENAATFVVVAPLALWFFRSAEAGAIVRHSAPLWGAFLLFFILRGSILHWKFGAAPMELMNNPFLKISGANWVAASAGEKMATILYTLGKYVLLLIFPHPLTHDYYPKAIPLMDFGSPMVLLSLALYGFLAWYAFSGISKKDPVRFGILFYLLTLSIVSNFVFPIGTNMGERFAFMPSVGFCLIVASGLTALWKGDKGNNTLAVLGVVLALFSLKTLTRNPAWSSNQNLFFTDVAVSGNSAKIRNACGGYLFEQATKEKDPAQVKSYCEQALVHLDKAVEIYRNYKDSYLARGGCHFLLKNYPEAIANYRAVLQISPEDAKGREMLAVSLREGGKSLGEAKGDAAGALRLLTEAWQINPKDSETARLLGVANGIQGKHADAITWFGKAVELAPDNASYLFDLGTAYFMSGDAVKGAQYREMAIQKDPKLKK